MKIGNVNLENNLMLAPIHGVNCVAFRLLCKKYGAGLVHTPMIHPESIDKVPIDIVKEESPVAAQIIGRDPELMVKAARILEEKADMININLGCPDRKELGRKTGGFFSKHPEQIEKFLSKVISAVNCPVTAKIRIGWDSQSLNHLASAKILEDLGVAAIAVHGRTVKQGYTGKANWMAIKQVKEKVDIPVIANGDVWDYRCYQAILKTTNADFVMIGRPSIGNPQIFDDCLALDETFKDLDFSKKLFREFLSYYKKYSPKQNFSEIKQHAMWFVKGVQGSSRLKNSILRTKTIEQLKRIIN